MNKFKKKKKKKKEPRHAGVLGNTETTRKLYSRVHTHRAKHLLVYMYVQNGGRSLFSIFREGGRYSNAAEFPTSSQGTSDSSRR